MKRYIIILIAIMMILVLVSCSKAEPDDTVKVWMYRYLGESGGDYEIMNLIETEITNYAEENKIKVEILNYKEDELSLEDYELKRNLALEHGRADIVIGDMYGNMAQMSDYAGDYTKLGNYKNVFDNFKGQYCIPICSLMDTIILDNEVLKSYGIECNKYITLDEYYEIKQSMKEKGAKFRYDRIEDEQLFNYYINKNKLEMIKENGKYTIDKESAMKTIKEVSEDIKNHYSFDTNIEKRGELLNIENKEKIVYDEALGRAFAQRGDFYPLKFLTFTGDYEFPFEDYTVVIRNDIEKAMLRMPCFFINKNTKEDNTYKVADFLISDVFQRRIYNNTRALSTVIDTPDVKEKTGHNDEWSYKYEPGVTKIYNQALTKNDINGIIKVVQKSYEIFKNSDTKKFYTPLEYSIAVRAFLIKETYRMINNQSYDETEFNKNADEFITNFNVQYN